jgi:hypothetical protein
MQHRLLFSFVLMAVGGSATITAFLRVAGDEPNFYVVAGIIAFLEYRIVERVRWIAMRELSR